MGPKWEPKVDPKGEPQISPKWEPKVNPWAHGSKISRRGISCTERLHEEMRKLARASATQSLL